MRLVNENFKDILESEIDLAVGYLLTTSVIKENASPIDNITKFALDDDDYEEVQMYVLNKELPSDIPTDTKEQEYEERFEKIESSISEVKDLLLQLLNK